MASAINTSQPDFISSGILRFAGAVCLVLILGWTWAFYGPHIIDDAYITFRFAKNIAQGQGIVYNPGEKIQGSSSPLFMVILGLCGALGLPIPSAALFLGILANLCIIVLLVCAGILMKREAAGWLAAMILSTQFIWVIIFVSGMETMAYALVILLALLAVSEEKWSWIGPLSAIACLLRYDGLILAICVFAALLWRGGGKIFLREILKAACVYLPWIIFSWVYFGSPVPQSVRAKMLINFLSWKQVFEAYKIFLSFFPLSLLWMVFVLLGIIHTVRIKRTWIVFPLWMGLFLLAFILTRRPVAFYPWYLVPLFPPFFLLGTLGFFQGIERSLNFMEIRTSSHKDGIFIEVLKSWKVHRISGVCILLVFVLSQMADLEEKKGEYGAYAFHRERKYQKATAVLSERIKPGKSVYVGELGTIGWFLPEAYVIDSSGLVSPQVTRIRRQDRENLLARGKSLEHFIDGSPDVTLQVLEQLKPDYILTDKKFLYIDQIQTDPLFQEHYKEIDALRLSSMNIWAFQRKK